MSALSPSELGALTQSPAEKKVGVSGKEEEEEEEGREKTMEEEGEREGEGEGEGEESEREEEDPLGQSAEDEVGKMLRSTLNDLETALEESRRLLAERDKELSQLKTEVETYKMQAAREIANKTKIAKSLDESLSHVREMEELTQQWKLEVRESRQVNERQETQLARERGKNRELLSQLEELRRSKEEAISQLTSQLLEAKKSAPGDKDKNTSSTSSSTGEEGLDGMTFRFLRQAVYHFLVDIHPEDHLRSISSILKFTPQERKNVYSKFGERKK